MWRFVCLHGPPAKGLQTSVDTRFLLGFVHSKKHIERHVYLDHFFVSVLFFIFYLAEQMDQIRFSVFTISPCFIVLLSLSLSLLSIHCIVYFSYFVTLKFINCSFFVSFSLPHTLFFPISTVLSIIHPSDDSYFAPFCCCLLSANCVC